MGIEDKGSRDATEKRRVPVNHILRSLHYQFRQSNWDGTGIGSEDGQCGEGNECQKEKEVGTAMHLCDAVVEGGGARLRRRWWGECQLRWEFSNHYRFRESDGCIVRYRE